MGTAKTRVIFTKGRRDMHDARAVRQGDVWIGDHKVGAFSRLANAVHRVRIKRLVFTSNQFTSAVGFKDAGILP